MISRVSDYLYPDAYSVTVLRFKNFQCQLLGPFIPLPSAPQLPVQAASLLHLTQLLLAGAHVSARSKATGETLNEPRPPISLDLCACDPQYGRRCRRCYLLLPRQLCALYRKPMLNATHLS